MNNWNLIVTIRIASKGCRPSIMDSILFYVGNMPACFDCREGRKEELQA